MKKLSYIIPLLLVSFCFAQTKNKYDFSISSVFPYEYSAEKKQESLAFLSGSYFLKKGFALGAKVGFSQGFQYNFANEKLVELFVSSSISIFDDETFVLKPSLGVGYYDNNKNSLTKPFCDISVSIVSISTKRIYAGMKMSSILLFSDNRRRTEYAGFVIGYRL